MTGRRGFTLVEVLVAVVLVGVVAVLAHRLFDAAIDTSRRLRAGRLELDHRSNAQRFLQAVFLSLEADVDGSGGFVGSPDAMRFSSWVPTADGWLERRTVAMRLDGRRWIASALPELDIELADSVTSLRFDYLLELGAESKWVAEWQSEVSAPLAVRVRLIQGERADTMLYLIKGRG